MNKKIDENAGQTIGWDHPLVKEHGICPEYLLRQVLPIEESTFENYAKPSGKWGEFCRNIGGVTFVSLEHFRRYLGHEIDPTRE